MFIKNKQTFFTLAITTLFVLFFSSCSSSDNNDDPTDDPTSATCVSNDQCTSPEICLPSGICGEESGNGDPDDEEAIATCLTETARINNLATTTITVSPGSGIGEVIVDGNTTTLRQVISAANSGDTILLEDGTYTFAESTGDTDYTGLYFTTSNITMRSASGNAEAVILDSEYKDHGGSASPIMINTSGTILASFTVSHSIFHLIHLSNGGDDTIIHNVRLLNGGQQFVKSSISGGSIDRVKVTCSNFTMTSIGRNNVWGYGDTGTHCYTGGIDSHNGHNWLVSDNHFNGIYCDASGVLRPAHGKKITPQYNGGLAEHAIHMWDSPQGTSHTITRNKIVNCARGIGMGLTAEIYGAIITNNMIYSEHSGAEHDIAISVMHGHGTKITNNTVFYSAADAFSYAIEYRFNSTTDTEISNNLTNKPIWNRQVDSANVNLSNNNINAEASWFIDPTAGDLHLANCNIATVANQGLVISYLTDDIDGDERQTSNDIGADECQP